MKVLLQCHVMSCHVTYYKRGATRLTLIHTEKR